MDVAGGALSAFKVISLFRDRGEPEVAREVIADAEIVLSQSGISEFERDLAAKQMARARLTLLAHNEEPINNSLHKVSVAVMVAGALFLVGGVVQGFEAMQGWGVAIATLAVPLSTFNATMNRIADLRREKIMAGDPDYKTVSFWQSRIYRLISDRKKQRTHQRARAATTA